jgi:hypothetical protein
MLWRQAEMGMAIVFWVKNGVGNHASFGNTSKKLLPLRFIAIGKPALKV